MNVWWSSLPSSNLVFQLSGSVSTRKAHKSCCTRLNMATRVGAWVKEKVFCINPSCWRGRVYKLKFWPITCYIVKKAGSSSISNMTLTVATRMIKFTRMTRFTRITKFTRINKSPVPIDSPESPNAGQLKRVECITNLIGICIWQRGPRRMQ